MLLFAYLPYLLIGLFYFAKSVDDLHGIGDLQGAQTPRSIHFDVENEVVDTLDVQ